MSRSSDGVSLVVLNRAVHQGSYFVHCLLIFNCFCLSISGLQGRPRNLPRCSPGLFLARVLLLSTEIVQQGQFQRTWHRVAQENRGGRQNTLIRKCWSMLAVQAARRAQEVAHARALELLALTEAYISTSAVQECIHAPLLPSVCLG